MAAKRDRSTSPYWITVKAAERRIAQYYLDLASGDIATAAGLAGVERSWLHRQVKVLGLNVGRPKYARVTGARQTRSQARAAARKAKVAAARSAYPSYPFLRQVADERRAARSAARASTPPVEPIRALFDGVPPFVVAAEEPNDDRSNGPDGDADDDADSTDDADDDYPGEHDAT